MTTRRREWERLLMLLLFVVAVVHLFGWQNTTQQQLSSIIDAANYC